MCNGGDESATVVSEDVSAAADLLGDTGAIVHSIAVGDNVDCDAGNDLITIPRNGGSCFSIPEPKALPTIIDDLIGTELTSVEVKVDDGSYRALGPAETGGTSLPQEGAISVDFETTVMGLSEGNHKVCIRATGQDSLGGVSEVVDCHEVEVKALPTPQPTPIPTTAPTSTPTMPESQEVKQGAMMNGTFDEGSNWVKGWTILFIVAASVGVLAVVFHQLSRRASGRMADRAAAEEESAAPVEVHQGVPVEVPPVV